MSPSEPSPEMKRAAETLVMLSTPYATTSSVAEGVSGNAFQVITPSSGNHNHQIEKAGMAMRNARRWINELKETDEHNEDSDRTTVRHLLILAIRDAADELEQATNEWDS